MVDSFYHFRRMLHAWDDVDYKCSSLSAFFYFCPLLILDLFQFVVMLFYVSVLIQFLSDLFYLPFHLMLALFLCSLVTFSQLVTCVYA